MPSGMCPAKARHLLQSLCEIVVMEEYFPTSIQQLITVVEKLIFEYLGWFCQILKTISIPHIKCISLLMLAYVS